MLCLVDRKIITPRRPEIRILSRGKKKQGFVCENAIHWGAQKNKVLECYAGRFGRLVATGGDLSIR
jgi:hypothetical protein